MNICKSKSKLSTIALILVLSISATLVILPLATAQEGTWNTWAICDLTPNPVGVNQEVLMILGITSATSWPQAGWEGLTVTVTDPEGVESTLGPYMTDTTGMTGDIYVPTKVGSYFFQVHFPEQLVTAERAGRSIPVGTVMKASSSEVIELVVQPQDLEYYPASPLPTEYWTRPINAQHREWDSIAGSWLDGSYMRTVANRYAPFNDGPETAHILWTKPLNIGGLVGEFNQHSFESGDAYEGKWANPVIIAGILVSNRYARGTQETFAINLRTGEELWSKELGGSIAFGQIMYWDTMNMHGSFAYIWSTERDGTWRAWNPLTGRNEYNMTNVPGGTRVPGPNGEIMLYNINIRSATLSIWNSTAAYYDWQLFEEGEDNPEAAYHAGRWRAIGQEFDASYGIQFEGTIPEGLPGAVEVVIPGDRAIGSNTQWSGALQQPNPVFWAINLKPGHEGELIFNTPWPLPVDNLHVDFGGSHPYSLEDGVFVIAAKETRQYWGLDIDTGEQLWGPTTWFEPYMQAYTVLYMDPWGAQVCAYGNVYTAGMGGVVNAYSLEDGRHLWEYKIEDPYSEQLFGNTWPAPTGFITDGKIYLFHMEHSVINPMPRGAPAVCLNAETGEEIWRINGLRLGTRWGGQPIIGDSVIAAFSSYDNNIVAIGKGPSVTTVTAPDMGVPLGSSVMIRGTVMDVSPGTEDAALQLRFPNGVPAISDEDMSEWMNYVYMQFEIPADPTGVDVYIDVVNPDGTWSSLGKVTSDMSGMFNLQWTPEAEGKYKIVATFMGSGGYYASFAETAIGVDPAPTPSGPITPEPEAPLITTEAAIILAVVAVAIIGIVGYLVIKKRK